MGKALIDANIVVALYRSDDSLHRVAVTVVSKLKESDWKLALGYSIATPGDHIEEHLQKQHLASL